MALFDKVFKKDDQQVNPKELKTKQIGFLQKYFGLGVDEKGTNPSSKLFPMDTKYAKSLEDLKDLNTINKDTFPPQVQRLYDFWFTTYNNDQSYKNRTVMYKDLEMLYYNSALISRAMNLIADEVVQADSNVQPIYVEAKKEIKEFILEFYDKINLYSYIRSTAFDIVQFGNAGWILGLDKYGVNEIIQTNVYRIKDRLEFSPAEVEEKIRHDAGLSRYTNQDRVKQLIDSILNKDNITSIHKKYLIGFIIGEYALPPWRFLHFRNTSNRSPFDPFGMPMYIHAIAPYKQWDAAVTFQVMARAAMFPIDVYSLNLPNILDPSEKLAYLTNFIEKLDNLGIRQTKKEDKALGDRLFTIKDLFEYQQISPQIDLGKMGEAEMLRDEVIVSTRLPRNIIDENSSGFGDSGVSLMQKWKEFSRLVFQVQSIILENITQMTKIHCILSGKFQLDDIDFVLSMPYPESRIDPEAVTNQKDLIDLSNIIMDTLSNRLMGGNPLPTELIKDVMHQIMPYDQKRISGWVDKAKAGQADNPEQQNQFGSFKANNPPETEVGETEQDQEETTQKWNKMKESVGRIPLKEKVRDIIFEAKQSVLREGKLTGRHYYSSKNKYLDFDVAKLIEFDKKSAEMALKEKRKVNYSSEEVEYDFAEEVKKDRE